jgi:hypothetical protein
LSTKFRSVGEEMPSKGHALTVTSLVDGLRWTPALAATVAVLLSGCGGSSSAAHAVGTPASKPKPVASKAPERKPDDTEQLRTLLSARSDAIRAGDAGALAGTSTGPQQERDRGVAAAAKPLPIAAVSITDDALTIKGDKANMRVSMEYSFDDIDSVYVDAGSMSAVWGSDGWRITRVRESGIRAPWEEGRYTPRASPHFLALTPKGLKVTGLMKDLEAGRARMQRALPMVKLPLRMLVLVTRGGTDTRALTRDVKALGSLTAIAEAKVDQEGPALRVKAVSGQRILVVWRAFGKRGADGRRTVIAHELTHAGLIRQTSGRTPVWLIEGMALWASGDERSGDAGALLAGGQLRDSAKQGPSKAVLSLSRLAKPTSMDTMSAVPLAFAYSYSSAAAFTIVEHYGRNALLRLYKAFNNEKIRGRAGRKLSDRVVRRTLHISLSTLQSQVDDYARRHSTL